MNIPVAGKAFHGFVDASATLHGLPASLIYATMAQESAFRPTAYRAEPKIHDGSHGLMQILLRTARALGYTGDPGEASKLTGLYDPAINIDLGSKLLAQNLKMTGSIAGAISAYNGGYRPSLGFGRPALKPVSICLARDQKTGECIRRRTVPTGQYANQPYVSAILARMEAYDGDAGPSVA